MRKKKLVKVYSSGTRPSSTSITQYSSRRSMSLKVDTRKSEIFWVRIEERSVIDRIEAVIGGTMTGEDMLMVDIEKLIDLGEGIIGCNNEVDQEVREIMEKLDSIDSLYADYVILWR